MDKIASMGDEVLLMDLSIIGRTMEACKVSPGE